MSYEIRNYRTSGPAYTATLYKDGKRIATVEDTGRGGSPFIWGATPNANTDLRLSIEADLESWAKTEVPEWYLTSHGTFPLLSANWELALGYLVERVTLDRLAKKKKVIVRDTQVYTMAPAAAHRPTDLVWQGSDWVSVAI